MEDSLNITIIIRACFISSDRHFQLQYSLIKIRTLFAHLVRVPGGFIGSKDELQIPASQRLELLSIPLLFTHVHLPSCHPSTLLTFLLFYLAFSAESSLSLVGKMAADSFKFILSSANPEKEPFSLSSYCSREGF